MRRILGAVIYEVCDAIALITFNRQERRNSLGGTLRQDIVSAMKEADTDAAVRVIILTGAGSAFCAGGDLNEMLDGDAAPDRRSIDEQLEPQRTKTTLSVFEAKKPVIAAINGAALGAGMNLALAADIRIASTAAVFGQSFVKRGLLPDYGGTYFLPRIVGHSKALELMFTAETIDASEALRIGLVSSVVEPEALLDVVWTMAAGIAEGAPVAIRLAKTLVNAGSASIHDALDHEAAAQTICYATEDGKEGLLAFKEKRAPVFKGR